MSDNAHGPTVAEILADADDEVREAVEERLEDADNGVSADGD